MNKKIKMRHESLGRLKSRRLDSFRMRKKESYQLGRTKRKMGSRKGCSDEDMIELKDSSTAKRERLKNRW